MTYQATFWLVSVTRHVLVSIDITAVEQYMTHSGPEDLFKTCVATKFVDDDDDDDEFTRCTLD